jgi:hypothetical protein
MTIRFKNEMYELLAQGAFGNSLRTWSTAQAVVESGYTGEIGLRSRTIAGPFYHRLPLLTALMIGENLIKTGHPTVYCEAAIDENIVLQGEICEVGPLLCLTYSTAKVQMRAAMQNPSYAEGLAAKTILRSYLSPSSYEDLFALLELYPGHTVEFTSFSNFVGELKGRSTCVWETRLY